MAWDGWAAFLNGVMIPGDQCSGNQELWDSLECYEATLIERMTAPPDGLGMPDLDTGDVDYLQSDGAQHFDDYYNVRLITLQVTLGPKPNAFGPVRKQLNALIKAWSRQKEDCELVLFTPENGNYEIGEPYLSDLVLRKNLAANPSLELDERG